MGRDFLGGQQRCFQYHIHFPPILSPEYSKCHHRGLGLLWGFAGKGLNIGGGARGNGSLQAGPKQPEVSDNASPLSPSLSLGCCPPTTQTACHQAPLLHRLMLHRREPDFVVSDFRGRNVEPLVTGSAQLHNLC